MNDQKNTKTIIHQHRSTILALFISVVIAGNVTTANAQSDEFFMDYGFEVTSGYDDYESTDYFAADDTYMTDGYDYGLPYCDDLVDDSGCSDGTGADACICELVHCIETGTGAGGSTGDSVYTNFEANGEASGASPAQAGGDAAFVAAVPQDCQQIANPLQCETCCARNEANALDWCKKRNDGFNYNQCTLDAQKSYETALLACQNLSPWDTFVCVTNARFQKGVMLEACATLWAANQKCVNQAKAEAKACEFECNTGVPIDSVVTGFKNLCRKLFK